MEDKITGVAKFVIRDDLDIHYYRQNIARFTMRNMSRQKKMLEILEDSAVIYRLHEVK